MKYNPPRKVVNNWIFAFKWFKLELISLIAQFSTQIFYMIVRTCMGKVYQKSKSSEAVICLMAIYRSKPELAHMSV